MLLSFETEFLRDLCLNGSAAEQQFSSGVVDSLFAVIADIRAAEFASDLFLGEFVEGDEAELSFILLGFGDFGVVKLVSNHRRHNEPARERVDWSQVRRIRIMEVNWHA